MQTAPKNWGGERKLQLRKRISCKSWSGKVERPGGSSLAHGVRGSARSAGLSQSSLILENDGAKYRTDFPNSDYSPGLRCSFLMPSTKELA